MAKLSKEKIINKTLELIVENNSSQALNIRQIARSLNCSHANIYNYYSGIEELRWDCLGEALIRMLEIVEKDLENCSSDKKFASFLHTWIKYGINNTGLYRLIWFDEFKGDIPENIKKIISIPMQELCNFLIEEFPHLSNNTNIKKIAHRIICYTHGEIAVFINQRSDVADKNEAFDEIYKNSLSIAYQIIKN